MQVTNSLPRARASPETFVLSDEIIIDYLAKLRQDGRSNNTLAAYRRCLRTLQNFLPDGKIGPDAPFVLQNRLLDAGYAPRSVNLCLSALSGLEKSLGLRSYPKILVT